MGSIITGSKHGVIHVPSDITEAALESPTRQAGTWSAATVARRAIRRTNREEGEISELAYTAGEDPTVLRIGLKDIGASINGEKYSLKK